MRLDEEQRQAIALDRARRKGDHVEAAGYLNVLGDACRRRGETAAAIEHHKSEVRECKLAAERDRGAGTSACGARRVDIAAAHRFLSLAYKEHGSGERALTALVAAQSILIDVQRATAPNPLQDRATDRSKRRAGVHRSAKVELQRVEVELGNGYLAQCGAFDAEGDAVRSVRLLHRYALPAFERFPD